MTLRTVMIFLATVLGLGMPVIVPNPAAAASAGPRRVCRISDKRLVEISGLVATRTGYVVVNDGSDDKARRQIFFLDRHCSVMRTVAYPSRPRDTEDLALAVDGTLWVADIGDNGLTRTTIGLWELPPGSRTPKLYRLAYPDGPHDAEALLLTPAGTPVVVTKTVATAGVYVPDGPVRAGQTTPLRRAGAVTVPLTGTSNPFSLPGRLVITGGAVSPDGQRAVLRTYADAFEFDVPDGDVVRAVTDGTPRTIPLPDEPQGESVAYSVDGTTLLTVSEVANQPSGTRPDLLSYALPDRPAATSAAARPSASPDAPATPVTASARRDRTMAGPLLALGVILVLGALTLGVFAARRARKSRHTAQKRSGP